MAEPYNDEDGYNDGRPMLDEAQSQQSLGESFISGEDSVVPDIQMLNLHCARAFPPRNRTPEAKEEAAASWEPVREWLRTRSAEEVRAAAEQRGDSAMTALHFACRNAPPTDVIDVFLSIAEDTVQWPDSFGWLPIHYACACGAETEVIKQLAEAFPESKTTVDRRGRTPLHFALGNSSKPVSPDVVVLLSSSGAAGYADDNGMLPLHYACAYGASEEALYVLTGAYPDAITTQDRRGRTPLHFALSNAGRRAAPSAVRLLVGFNRDIVNSRGGSSNPLRVLAEFASTIREDDDQKDSVHKCLEHLLNAEPEPTADFFTALQSLPDWLSEQAVVMEVVQTLLNEKISQRFPTAVLMVDAYVLVMVIITYSFNVQTSIERRNECLDQECVKISASTLMPLYLGGSYFLLREIIQLISLLSLKAFNVWYTNATNWLNLIFVFCVLFWTGHMQNGTADNDFFRVGCAFSVTVLWTKLLGYLRNVLIDFAVFVGGVFYVVNRLAAFLISLGIILIAFSQMFFTIFLESDTCLSQPEFNKTELNAILRCEGEAPTEPFCNRWTSFLRVYTMLLGEVDENEFFYEGRAQGIALALFLIFMFLVVILLANVLIAIVTDSYKVIQDQRAAIVFWTNRLDFVAEMDAIANGPWKAKLKKSMGWEDEDGSGGDGAANNSNFQGVFGKESWKRLMDLFEDEIDDSVVSLEYFLYTLLRVSVAVIVIPLWIFLGVVTAGWLWPPQIREAVFTSSVFKHTNDSEREDELRKIQVKKLEQEVKDLKDELLKELAMDRTQVVQMKSVVAERKVEIANEMKHVKRIVTMLFEQLSGFG
ncbi:Ankyrin Repeat [Seminavis robusta]|uniref:Ankyrin Repeat n=1 Tax=Seminavis robusta TaxID=568900 RepID=A0A9N8EWW5_9STRA|nr:Ankyrin Repeat [Seminavis robusta]|eukprot:Sro1934_g306300.1 Ankyrin Repeat (822) ;mRNA; f:5492-8238